MKKVLIFSLNYYPRFIGGAEIAIKEITDRISTEEVEFHMVTLRFDSSLPKIEKIGNVTVHRIGFVTKDPSIEDLNGFPLRLNKFLYQILAIRKAEELHRMHSYDGIWAMMAHSCAIPAGIFKKRHPEVQYLLTLQEGDPPEHIERMMRPIWRLFKQGFVVADTLQPISSFLKDWGLRMGFNKEMCVIPNGVDVELFSKEFSEEEKRQMQEKLGKKEGDVFLVTTSRLVHKNGIADGIRALQLLPSKYIFLIYGIGPEETRLKELAKKIGVEDRARFMGEIAHAEIPHVFSACDIFIRPSRSEGMGNSFIEAMAAKIPVIATQEGGIRDFLFDTKRNPDKAPTGFAVDTSSPEQIASTAIEIHEQRDVVESVLHNAYANVCQNYTWEGSAKEMKVIFSRMGEPEKAR